MMINSEEESQEFTQEREDSLCTYNLTPLNLGLIKIQFVRVHWILSFAVKACRPISLLEHSRLCFTHSTQVDLPV
jgi:hypothetical protein